MTEELTYEGFADEYAKHAVGSPWNSLYDRPAVMGLAGDVAGLRVLDAGCGPGLYAEALIRAGAQVMGCDQSPALISRARERTGGAADLRVHDLSEPLTWVPDDSVDLVVCALTLHYIDDRVALLREFRRVLAPGGAVALSTHHPTSDWLRLGGSYFTERVVTESLHPERDWQVRFWHRSLTAMCAEFREAGFLISELLEPRPVEEMAQRDADAYARLSTAPAFIAFRLTPRLSGASH
jgi:ubiquinone/menaquinone biosynthesis C-methylase UbiE